MRRAALTLVMVVAVVVHGTVSYAQHGNGGAPKPKPPVATTHTTMSGGQHTQTPTKPSGGATTHGNSGATTHGNAGTSHASGTAQGGNTTHASGAGSKATTTANATATSGKSNATGTSTTTGTSNTTGTSSTATTGGTTATLTPVQQKLQTNTQLAGKLSSRLPAGTDLMTAASGFRNLGQFVAAVNVSNNLGIPFAELKTSMVADHKSLGQSIQVLKPTADAKVEAQRAEDDAAITIRSTENTTASKDAKGTSSKPPNTTGKPRSGGGL